MNIYILWQSVSGPFRRFLKNRSQILGFFFGFQKIVPAACLKPARNHEKGRHMHETGTKFGKEPGRPRIIGRTQNHWEGPESSGRPKIIGKALSIDCRELNEGEAITMEFIRKSEPMSLKIRE